MTQGFVIRYSAFNKDFERLYTEMCIILCLQCDISAFKCLQRSERDIEQWLTELWDGIMYMCFHEQSCGNRTVSAERGSSQTDKSSVL